MRTRNLLSAISTLALAVVFFASSSFAQTDSVKTRTQTKAQIKSQVKTQLNYQNQGDTSQARNQVRVNEGQGTMTRDQKYGNGGTKGFIDLNGDGINDNAIDSDGDGIPNGQDADYVRPQDGTGQKNMKGKNSQIKLGGNKYGPGDGTGTGVGPQDGTGYGPGDGTCDGTGTKRGGRK